MNDANGKSREQRRRLRKTKAEWEWRKNYRVWDAKRKIFLYPENWIEPELRLSTRFRAALDDVVAFICAKCGAKTKRKPIDKPARRKGARVLLTARDRMGALIAAHQNRLPEEPEDGLFLNVRKIRVDSDNKR